MGEYAKRLSDGAEIKIGTCEDMYYLRADQRGDVKPLRGSCSPASERVARVLRFRFPWPDEDGFSPGDNRYHDNGYHRGVAVATTTPISCDHHSVQFTAHAGYVTSLPCPEGPEKIPGLTIHRNGFAGAVQLVAQKLLADGRLVPVVRCGGCHAMARLEEPSEIEALAVAFRAEGDRAWKASATGAQDRRFWDAIADRILAGAQITPGTDAG